jgi:hypothetical protein
LPKKNKLKNKWLDNATVMAKAKSKQKKGKQTNLSKARKKGGIKKKATAKVRKGGKKKAARRKAAPRSTAKKHVETVPAPAAFTEIASEEVTSSLPALGEQDMIGSTESSGVSESGFTSTDSDSNTEFV